MGLWQLRTCVVLAVLVGVVIAANRGERTDAFRVIEAFSRPVSIYKDSNNSPFKCLSATRTRFDPQAKEATYIWHLKDDHGKVKQNVSFDVEKGKEFDQVTFYVDDDRTQPFTAYLNYTDYQNCIVVIVPYSGHNHCMMWLQRRVAHNVPQNCLDKYEEKCGVKIPTFDSDLCKDD
uniref:Putative lipocalin n=1 Tax=Rhipicephalus microplus TaxID=6941 RepID=A0A6G5A390_RHIMP